MNIVAVIPCCNEAKHIAGVVTESCKHVHTVLVADGRSTDNSRAVAINAGAKVILPNADFVPGYGHNVRRGFKYAVEKYQADIIVLLDGDGQHNPADIPKLLKPILSGTADIVMGERRNNFEMPNYRYIGNRLLSKICNAGARFKPPDAMIGFWAIRARALPVLTESTWGAAIELLIKSRVGGCRMVTVPVQTIYHDNHADNSQAPAFSLGLNLLWYIVKWRIRVEVLGRGEKCQ